MMAKKVAELVHSAAYTEAVSVPVRGCMCRHEGHDPISFLSFSVVSLDNEEPCFLLLDFFHGGLCQRCSRQVNE